MSYKTSLVCDLCEKVFDIDNLDRNVIYTVVIKDRKQLDKLIVNFDVCRSCITDKDKFTFDNLKDLSRSKILQGATKKMEH